MEWKYGPTLINFYNECPYDLDLDNDELAYKQVLTWFAYDRKNAFGKTIIDEFVNKFVDDKKLRSKILQMKNLTYDTFFIQRSADARNMIRVVAESSGKIFEVEIMGNNPDVYKEGRIFTGRIHPWHEDGTYRVTGITKILVSDEDLFRQHDTHDVDLIFQKMERQFQEKAESITISTTPKAATLLRQLPIEWVDRICDSLYLDMWCVKKEKIKMIVSILTSKNLLEQVVAGLSEDERIALRFVLKKGGSVKHADLCRRVGRDDTQWSWSEKSFSTVGRLRRHGLLVVGKKRIMTKTYKVAAIPADVAMVLKSCL